MTDPATSLFPFRCDAREYSSMPGAFSPPLAEKVWLRLRREAGQYKAHTWYATEFTAVSPTRITLRVFRIDCSIYGGIGQKIVETEVTDLTAEELQLLKEETIKEAQHRAETLFEKQEEKIRQDKILELRKATFGV